MYPMVLLYLAIIAVAVLVIVSRLRPGSVDARLWRHGSDRMIGGVMGGLGRRFGLAPLWFRLAWCAAFVLLGDFRFQLMGAYVVLWAITPREPQRTTVNGQVTIDGTVVPGRPGGQQQAPPVDWRLRRNNPTLPW